MIPSVPSKHCLIPPCFLPPFSFYTALTVSRSVRESFVQRLQYRSKLFSPWKLTQHPLAESRIPWLRYEYILDDHAEELAFRQVRVFIFSTRWFYKHTSDKCSHPNFKNNHPWPISYCGNKRQAGPHRKRSAIVAKENAFSYADTNKISAWGYRRWTNLSGSDIYSPFFCCTQ